MDILSKYGLVGGFQFEKSENSKPIPNYEKNEFNIIQDKDTFVNAFHYAPFSKNEIIPTPPTTRRTLKNKRKH